VKKTKDGRSSQATTKARSTSGGAKKIASKSLHLDINPGLRDRLVSQLDESGIPEEGRLSYLCAMTGRVPQTVRRWIEPEKPGLPDLQSFAVLCVRFDTDANWFLGLSDVKYRLPETGETKSSTGILNKPTTQNSGWLDYLSRQTTEKVAGCEVIYMPGDEMEPRIQKGAPIFVNKSIKTIEGNGIYVLEYQGRTVVRIVENRIGEGLVLSCENIKYKDTVLKDQDAVKKMGLTVIGKAEHWVQLVSG